MSGEARANLAWALARDLRQLNLESAAVFVESQQREIERLNSEAVNLRARLSCATGKYSDETHGCKVHGEQPCLRWCSHEGLGGHPSTHDALRWAREAPESLQCNCVECKAFRVPVEKVAR